MLVRSRRTVWLACCFLLTSARAQAAEPSPQCPQTTGALYARIHSVGLDPDRVYHVRGATIDRPNLHIDFDDGTLAFTSDICGRTTGAFFDGEGEVRLRPPNRAERGSLALFTGMAILEEQFTTAYLRFNDDTATLLQPFLTPAPEPAGFIKEWGDTSLTLAKFDGLRLLLDFSHFLPSSSSNATDQKFLPLLHAHLLGKRLGGFEIVWDAANQEPLWAGQPRMKDDNLFFDIWTSFAPAGTVAPPIADASITNFRIHASVEPPTRLQALADLNLQIRSGGERTLLFELSRYLKVEAIESDDHPVDFIQNPAIEGSELRRKGNDLVAVVFPAPLAPSQQLNLRFRYAGDVLSEAGTGLLYVGERGTWYPNFGLSPAHFDLEFRYPPDWTLVATGKQVSRASAENSETNPTATTEKVSRWISERPIPVAGFNLGKYVRAEAKAGHVVVEAYGTKGVEKSFPKAHEEVVTPILPIAPQQRLQPMEPLVVTPPPPSPARDAQAVADRAARSITSFSQWFGPYPFNSLALTQMPGLMSQGWPGLVFLSSFAFLSPREQADLHLGPVASEIDNLVLAHETAHQWWGDLVLWNSYRDQWLAEGLANYASLLMLEQRNPAQFQQILEKYRHDLLSKNNDGEWLRDAGPVTFGQRLDSSHFPNGYDEISYERGTWLFHMLRTMLLDSEAASPSRKGRPNSLSEEPFFRGLRKIRERYAGRSLSTQELLHVFEEELPRPLWYENHHKLDWFLQGWIEGTAIPHLEAREIHIAEKNGVTTVTGVIVQKDAPNDLVTAVPVYAAMPGNTLVFLGEVLADGAETAFHLPAPHAARKILLDPKQTILSLAK
ncbi:MAG: M1 family aminopeptidase [Terriglobales bacterium]